MVSDTVIADSETYQEVEGNVYFPDEAVNHDHLEASEKTTVCPWKGKAAYYHVVADGDEDKNAAWSYHDPKDDASHIKDYVAFNTDKVTIDKEA